MSVFIKYLQTQAACSFEKWNTSTSSKTNIEIMEIVNKICFYSKTSNACYTSNDRTFLVQQVELQWTPSYKATPTKGHLSYQARFQIHSDSKIQICFPAPSWEPPILWSKILLNCPYEESHSSYKATFFNNRRDGLTRGGLPYWNNW